MSHIVSGQNVRDSSQSGCQQLSTPMNTPSSELALTIITYKRADKLRFLLQSLSSFPASKIYIFCDGPRGRSDLTECQGTQKVAQAYAKDHPSVCLEIREKNLGLNENIIQSITSVLQKHPFTLVLEEDVIPSPGLAAFIQHYEPLLRERTEVFSINAHHPCEQTLRDPVFLSRRFFCWGWATWADRWNAVLPHLRGDIWPYEHYWEIPAGLGSDLAWAHRQHRMGRRKITFARLLTLWTLKLNLLHFCPHSRLSKNIGLDGSGEHCTQNDTALALSPPAQEMVEQVKSLPRVLKPHALMEENIHRFFTNPPRGTWRKRVHYQLVRFVRGLQPHYL